MKFRHFKKTLSTNAAQLFPNGMTVTNIAEVSDKEGIWVVATCSAVHSLQTGDRVSVTASTYPAAYSVTDQPIIVLSTTKFKYRPIAAIGETDSGTAVVTNIGTYRRMIITADVGNGVACLVGADSNADQFSLAANASMPVIEVPVGGYFDPGDWYAKSGSSTPSLHVCLV